jgi:hypothetical protein
MIKAGLIACRKRGEPGVYPVPNIRSSGPEKWPDHYEFRAELPDILQFVKDCCMKLKY